MQELAEALEKAAEVVTPPSSEVCAGDYTGAIRNWLKVVTPPSSEVCAGFLLHVHLVFVSRNPSELRGLCRLRRPLWLADGSVVTPPSSEVCAGRNAQQPPRKRSRNPSELRGLCRQIHFIWVGFLSVVTPPSSEVCAGPILKISILRHIVVTPPSSEVCAGPSSSGGMMVLCRNPSELRGLCRLGTEISEALPVVTPPSSEVCAGAAPSGRRRPNRRNPSELRGLCRWMRCANMSAKGRNPSELRGLCRGVRRFFPPAGKFGRSVRPQVRCGRPEPAASRFARPRSPRP